MFNKPLGIKTQMIIFNTGCPVIFNYFKHFQMKGKAVDWIVGAGVKSCV